MKNKINKEIIISTLCCFIPTILCLFIYDKLPNELPVHFGANGSADGFVSKQIFVYVMPFAYALLNIFLNVFLNNDPKRKNSSKVIFTISKWLVPILTVLFSFISILSSLYKQVDTGLYVLSLMGLVFIIIGNYLPKCKQNYTVGIKLPWTLNSEENWNKTHRLAGYVFMLCGIMQIVFTFFKLNSFVLISSIILMLLIPTVYSFILYKQGI